MEEFAHNYCAYFDYIEDRTDFESAENKLIYTQIHQKFQESFEGELSTFLASLGWTADRFVEEYERELKLGEEGDSRWGSIYEIIVSLTDYAIFKVMMLDTRRKFPELTAAPAQ